MVLHDVLTLYVTTVSQEDLNNPKDIEGEPFNYMLED
jgi:hypothetical protein